MRTLTGKKSVRNFADRKSVATFAVRHFHIIIWFGDLLCPTVSYCLTYKQRFLRTYLPQGQYGSVATWRNSLLLLFINQQFSLFMRHLNENQIFQYNGSPISFQSGDSVMVNATQMAKPFGKRPAKWLELPSTKEFLKTLSTIRKSDSEFVVTINGGTTEKGKGTWMHEDVALEFARWLSPAFAIWCNDRIKEILVGKSAKEDYSWVNPSDYTRQDLADIIIEKSFSSFLCYI